MAIKIILNNSKSRLIGSRQTIDYLREETKIKSPDAFWSQARRSGRWDGYVKYITEATNMFPTGMLPQILELLKQKKVKVTVEEQRDNMGIFKLKGKLGNLELRHYQSESAESLLHNEIYGLPFQRGILYEATNAGKNLIAATIVKAYKYLPTLFLINNTEIYVQAVEELNELLPGKVGEIWKDKFKWKLLNVAMVQTLANRLKNPKVKELLARTPIVIVDEADEVINRKDCRDVFNTLYNAPVRVALTGTALKNKNKIKNQWLISFFGPVIHQTSNKQLVDWGYSAKPIIKFVHGMQEFSSRDYQTEYLKNIIRNKERNAKIWRIAQKQIKNKRGPILIIVRYHEHIKRLLKSCPENMQENLTIKRIHGEIDMGIRKRIIKDFIDRKVDILISSMILRRGKNIKSLKTLVNGAGGDSEANILQILGRALRMDVGKSRVWVYEFFDTGKYLTRHSNHRIKYYKKEGFEVKELYKAKLKKLRGKNY